jgi:DNA (cytosine-5)-methyltransferase 1
LNELALFAGAGGGLLASQLLGWRTVCAVEINNYCQQVLLQRQRDGMLDRFPIWTDVRSFDGQPWRGIVDIVSGGFPCQGFSSAASGRNCAEDLWPEMRRVVADVAPWGVFAENVQRRAIDWAAEDLEEMGYKTKAIKVSAADMGADHIRERYWLFAYTHAESKLWSEVNAKMAKRAYVRPSVWDSYPSESRMVDGVAHRMERFGAIGNGQVPAVVVRAWNELSSVQITGLNKERKKGN